jgi:hypothetical protein
MNETAADFVYTDKQIIFSFAYQHRADHSGRPLGLSHEMSSLARTLGSWDQIPLKA